MELTVEPLAQPQLYELIVERLVEQIGSGRLREGERLPAERELALGLEVSRSSLREAIGALKVDGLIETRRGSGSFVVAGASERARSRGAIRGGAAAADASPFAVIAAREVLEPGIARAAAERGIAGARAEELLVAMESVDVEDPLQRDRWSDADRLFHREIAVLSDNPVMLGLADRIATLMDQPLWRRLRDDLMAPADRVAIHAADHRLIYQNVIEGEPEAAAAQSLNHLQRVQRQMKG